MRFFHFKKQKSNYTISQILHWLWRRSRGNRFQAMLNALVGVSQVGLSFLFVWGTKLAVDIATHQTARFSLTEAGVILICIIVAQISLTIASRWIQAILGVKAQNQMQKQIFERILRSEWRALEKHHSGDILNRLELDVKNIIQFLTESLPSLLTVLVQFVGAFLFLFWLDRKLAVVIVLILPTFLLVSRIYVRRMRKLTREVRDSDSQIQSILQESIQHRMLIQTLQRSDTQVGKLDKQQRILREQVKTRTIFSTFTSTFMTVGFAVGYLVTFLWGVSQLEKGLITYGSLMAFIQLVGQIQGPARSLMQYVPTFISAFTAGERLMELEEAPLEHDKSNIRLQAPVGIRYEDVTYSYSADAKPVLLHFNFDFHPGSCTAILGETGSGKTTLLRLMLALIHPQEGKVVLYNAQDALPCDASLRNHLAYVPQGNTLLSGTIRSNLLLGKPKATDEELREALHIACADFVFSLPEGLDNRCEEHGVGLSEGQAQRICIARALLRQVPVLIFDEATSALDSLTEEQLIRNLSALKSKQTILFVTHRKAILELCNQELNLQHLSV